MIDTTQPAAVLMDEAETALSNMDGELAKSLRSLHATMQARADATGTPAREPGPPQVEQKGQLILFPPWAEDRRAAVNAIFRSALFPALNNKNPRRYLEQERLFSVEGVEVFFTGKQFDQSDLDVYLELLNIAHKTPFGVECCFTAYSLLKALGRTTGKADYQQLHSQLIRLCGGVVDMTDHVESPA